MGEEAKVFTELIFPDLDKEEAKKLVEEYNKVSFYFLTYNQCCNFQNIIHGAGI